jgi:hypothetical protein
MFCGLVRYPALKRSFGEMVTIFPADHTRTGDQNGPDLWLSANVKDDSMGEVTEQGLNGLLTVRLGALKNPQDIQSVGEGTWHAYSPGDKVSDDEVSPPSVNIGLGDCSIASYLPPVSEEDTDTYYMTGIDFDWNKSMENLNDNQGEPDQVLKDPDIAGCCSTT